MDKNETIIQRYVNQLATVMHELVKSQVDAEALQAENAQLKSELKARDTPTEE